MEGGQALVKTKAEVMHGLVCTEKAHVQREGACNVMQLQNSAIATSGRGCFAGFFFYGSTSYIGPLLAVLTWRA